MTARDLAEIVTASAFYPDFSHELRLAMDNLAIDMILKGLY